jgi:hypothetical protein
VKGTEDREDSCIFFNERAQRAYFIDTGEGQAVNRHKKNKKNYKFTRRERGSQALSLQLSKL